MLALYRKYRPETFGALIGQAHTKEILQAEVAHNQVAHAYLFVGPRGTGKTSTARILAAAINCEKQKGGEPCTVCAHCKAIREGRYLDLIEIDAASQTGVDNVRENIIESARFVPQVGKWKTYLIDEAHMLSSAAWNALLKTLEEPPERVMFIFATTEPRKMPDTILSRCQQFRFTPVEFEVLKARLTFIAQEEGVVVEKKVLSEIALRAGGYIRDAESLLGQVLSLGGKKVSWKDAEGILGHTAIDVVQGLMACVVKGAAGDAVEKLEELREEGVDLYQLPGHALDLLRAMHYHALTDRDHPLLVKRYGSEGIAAVAALLAVNADAAVLRRALTALVERQAAAHELPPDLFLEIILSELAEIFSEGQSAPGHSSPVIATPPERRKQSDAMRHPEPVEGSLHSSRDDTGKRLPRRSGGVGIPRNGLRTKTVPTASEPAEEEKPAPKNKLTLQLQAIKDVWGAFVDKVHIRNRALQFILRTAEPLRVNENRVHLGVHYQFHLEKLGEANNRKIIEDVLAELLGGPVIVQLELLKNEAVEPAASAAEEDPSVLQLMNLFGGKVVES